MKSFEQMTTYPDTEKVSSTTNGEFAMPTTYPLHPAQNEVFRAQLIDVKAPYYNVGAYLKLKGHFDREKFIEAVASAPKTFDAFKMRFLVAEGDVVLFFDDAFTSMEVSVIDFSDALEPDIAAQKWMKSCFNLSFDVQKDEKLFQNVLIKIRDDEHWFFMRYHHLIMDGYGFKVWLQYLSQKYSLLNNGEESRFFISCL